MKDLHEKDKKGGHARFSVREFTLSFIIILLVLFTLLLLLTDR
ncbi:MAG TPA: hypothetical protein VE912_07325 [Bacteroidales bacterium]|nr:hypothetical protein [Bacteroidales bacterium]